MSILERVKVRIPDELDDNLLNELIETAKDRICLRLGVEEIPNLFTSICVDVVIKLYRRQYYEGISSESADTINTSFVNDVLSEYESEFDKYIKDKERNALRSNRKVRFI